MLTSKRKHKVAFHEISVVFKFRDQFYAFEMCDQQVRQRKNKRTTVKSVFAWNEMSFLAVFL